MRILLFLFSVAGLLANTDAARATTPQGLVNNAAAIVRSYETGDRSQQVRTLLRKSRAVFIVPSYYRAGFILGGSGGVGVLMARDMQTGQWGYPGFANMGGVSFGLQAGATASEVLIFIMTDKGLESLINNQLRLGGSAGLAFATVGAEISGSKGLTSGADFVTMARSVGLYGGINLEGAAIEQRRDLAKNFYGQPASLYPILILQQYQNPAAQPLQQALAAVEGRPLATSFGSTSSAYPPAPPLASPARPAPVQPSSGQTAPGFEPPAVTTQGVEVINQPFYQGTAR